MHWRDIECHISSHINASPNRIDIVIPVSTDSIDALIEEAIQNGNLST